MTEPVSGDRASDIYHGPDNQTPSPAGCFGGWRKGKRFSPRGSVFRAQAPWPAPRRSCRGRGRKGSSTQHRQERDRDSRTGAPVGQRAGRTAPAAPHGRGTAPGASPSAAAGGPAPPQHPPPPEAAGASPLRLHVSPGLPAPSRAAAARRARSRPAALGASSAGRVLALPAAPRAPRGRAGTALGSAPPAPGPRTRFDPPSPQLQGLHLRAGGCRSRPATAAPAQECPVLWLFPSVSPPSGTDGWPCCPGRGA